MLKSLDRRGPTAFAGRDISSNSKASQVKPHSSDLRSIHSTAKRIQLPPSREKFLAKNDELPKEDGKQATASQQIEKEVKQKQKQKTMAELDEELRLKLEGVSGEGGTAGVEYEGGKAVGLKRGVKDNMFRII